MNSPFISMMMRILLTLALMIGGISPAFAATWVVDKYGGPGSDFTVLQDAIDAAATGDLILVRNGDYQGFILSKALTLAAETGHSPSVNGDSIIENSPLDRNTVVSRFFMNHLDVRNCLGPLLIENCGFKSSTVKQVPLKIDTCDHVNLSRCIANGKKSSDIGMDGVSIKYAKVVISGSVFIGGWGKDNFYKHADHGARGISAYGSTLYVQTTSAFGGDGGAYTGLFRSNGGDGGAGIEIDDCALHLHGLKNHIIEGGNAGGSTLGALGKDGSAVKTEDSTIFYSGVGLRPKGKAPKFYSIGSANVIDKLWPEIPIITLEGSGLINDKIETTLFGDPGSLFMIYCSSHWTVLPINNMHTHLHLDPGTAIFFAGGAIPPGRSITYVIPLTNNLTPFKGTPIHFQAYLIHGLGQGFLSASAAFVLR